MRKENIVSPNAADLIHEATSAVKFGLTTDDIMDAVHALRPRPLTVTSQ